MENESRIVELLTESLFRQDKMVDELQKTNERLAGVERQLEKLNLQTTENTRAIFKLADRVEQIAELDKRVKELEKVVFK